MILSCNECVRVRLTALGRAQLEKNYYKIYEGLLHTPKYNPPREVEGWTSFQLWELMTAFGPHITFPGELYFDLDIEIPDKLGAGIPT